MSGKRIGSRAVGARRALLALACLLWLVGSPLAAGAVPIVAPNGFEAADGDIGNRFPFFRSNSVTNNGSMRYQQVYAATEFGAIAAGGGTITEVAFRGTSSSPPFSVPLSSIQLNLSTTAAGPDALSAVFADNVGLDDTIVFGPAPFTVSSVTPANFDDVPKPFEIIFPLLTPFFYDPVLGNLLLDVRIPTQGVEPSGVALVDGTLDNTDPVSRAYSFTGDVDSAVADQMSSLGLITRFQATPIPEPATALLLALGLGGLGVRRRPARRAARR